MLVTALNVLPYLVQSRILSELSIVNGLYKCWYCHGRNRVIRIESSDGVGFIVKQFIRQGKPVGDYHYKIERNFYRAVASYSVDAPTPNFILCDDEAQLLVITLSAGKSVEPILIAGSVDEGARVAGALIKGLGHWYSACESLLAQTPGKFSDSDPIILFGLLRLRGINSRSINIATRNRSDRDRN